MSQVTQELVKEFLNYDPDFGIFTWKERDAKWFKIRNYKGNTCKTWNAQHANKVSGSKYTNFCGKTYLIIGILSKRYPAHRLAWLYMTGVWPEEVDHINGNGLDNRWCNLRNVNSKENSHNTRKKSNNTSGVCGVYWHKLTNKWQASICVDRTLKYLGLFDNFEDAVLKRKEAEIQYCFHPNHGSERPL